MRKLLIAFFAFAALSFSQALTSQVTNGGSGYNTTNLPTVTASGGTCTTQPTFTANVVNGSVSSLNETFGGICPAGATAPTLTITCTSPCSGGSGATAIIPVGGMAAATVVLLAQGNGGVNGECILTVPANQTYFYSSAYTQGGQMFGTQQKTNFSWGGLVGAAAQQTNYTGAFAAGVISAYEIFIPASLTVAQAQAPTLCGYAQTNLNNWNPWVNYGNYYNGTWNQPTVN